MKTLIMIVCLLHLVVMGGFGQLNVGFESSIQKINYLIGKDKQQVKLTITAKGDAFQPNTILKISANIVTGTISLTDFKFMDSPFTDKIFLNLDNYPKKTIDVLIEINKPSTGSNVLVLDIKLDNIYGTLLQNAASYQTIKLINDSVVPAVSLANSPKMEIDTTNIFRTDFNQYTDVLGFSDTAPNGLIQQEFKFKIPLNTRPKFYDKGGSFQYFRSMVLSFLINRIDKNQKQPTISSTQSIITDENGNIVSKSTSPVVSTFDLLRRSTFELDTRWVLIGYRKKDFRIYLDGRLGLLRNSIEQTSIAIDSVKKTSDTTTFSRALYSTNWGLNLYLQNRFDAFEIIGEVGFRKIALRDSYFKQYDQFDISPFGNREKLIALPSNNLIWYFTTTFKYNLNKDNDFLFLRVLYHIQDAKNIINRPVIADATLNNNFLQIQAGVNLKIPALSGSLKN